MSLIIGGSSFKYGNLDVEMHGGHCCGRFHLHDFPWVSQEANIHPDAVAKKTAFLLTGMEEGARLLWDEYGPVDDDEGYREPFSLEDCSYCAEVVLTSHQRETWEQVLFDCGFKLVYTFRNSNSGNECFVYMATVGTKYA